ncbi:unnamed protein product [Ceutorhynchus assimilis]|uniref:UDP-glucuronosyltransferase n=1 Tax=Ceutorhynchus assimilis TaxID=467358 RepID=A0A9N9MRM4_9CUCU|nr:unnamed protein product [Ceutorhynchus assimilis]
MFYLKLVIIKIIFLCILIENVKTARILGVFPIAGKSLNILSSRLMKGLADAGHDVTAISAFDNKFKIANNGSYRNVVLTGFSEKYDALMDQSDFYSSVEKNSLWASYEIHEMLISFYNETFRHPNVQNFLKEDQTFDLVIIECLWSDSLLVFQEIYNCPLAIFVHTGGVNPWAYEMVGNPLPISYVPHYWLLTDGANALTFFERLHNLLFFLFDHVQNYFISWPDHNEILKSVLPNLKTDVAKLYYGTPSLILLGTHNSLRQPVPMAPNMIEIGGFHINPPKSLPNDLQEFLDNAKEGVIYFSMGSHLLSKSFSEEKKKLFLNAFRKLKVKVLWKFEDEVLPGKPDNVFIKKWVPQQDILAHPNVKLFITHGGYGSTLETVYHGVPTLVIPVFFDQFTNANRAVLKGYGLKLSFNDPNFTEEVFSAKIEELISNPKYMRQAKYVSQVFHDRPMKPLETLVYWVEYVIRHKGADHLKLGGAQLPWYKFYMVDVIVFLVLIILATPYLMIKTFKKIVCKSKARKQKKN